MTAIPAANEIKFLNTVANYFDKATYPNDPNRIPDVLEASSFNDEEFTPIAELSVPVRALILDYSTTITDWMKFSGILNRQKTPTIVSIIEDSAQDRLIRLGKLAPKAEGADAEKTRREDEKALSHAIETGTAIPQEEKEDNQANVEKSPGKAVLPKDRVKTLYTEKLMLHIYDSVMENASEEQRMEIGDLAIPVKVIAATKSRCRKMAMKVGEFFVKVLRNRIVQVAVVIVVCCLAIKIYTVAYALFNTYVLATMVPKLATLLINYAPAIVTQAVSALVGAVHFIATHQLHIAAGSCFALLATRSLPRVSRVVSIIATICLFPLSLVVNVFFNWPVQIVRRSKILSERAQITLANFLHNINISQKARFVSEGEKAARRLWINLTLPSSLIDSPQLAENP